MISAERLWLNADKSAVVADGDPNARFLLVGVGGNVPAEFADLVSASAEALDPEPEPEVDPEPEVEAHVAKPAPSEQAAAKPKTSNRK